MKIGVDAKFASPHYGGLGTYSIKIIDALCRLGRTPRNRGHAATSAGRDLGGCPRCLGRLTTSGLGLGGRPRLRRD